MNKLRKIQQFIQYGLATAVLFGSMSALAGDDGLKTAEKASDKRSDSAEKSQAADVLQKTDESQKNAENAPLFRDGKGYYSYKKALDIPLPPNKVLIQYFYRYGCAVCQNADDYLTAYAQRNADKVELVRSPVAANSESFTARLKATFEQFGRPELADKYLFDSAETVPKNKLVENNDAIRAWLVQHQIDIPRFHQLFESPLINEKVAQARQLYDIYSPPMTPIAVLNGKYILVQNTLYNDDYTNAVLDFLIEKLQQEQTKQEKTQ